ncbi:hypothetical protein SIM22_05040 [Bacillus cereus group sp. BfR-BA-01363]|uniref:hypothetical protein n=1 Tax=Bacillus cereus group sp. BfR-BA-01363 TaxID=3094882 RepID=UPI0029C43A38|nr:hypothetical protein [Bacillus cereus group sp. BfR-BA-01363]MDX5853497.1 hypothetical protein [Bacillus cereus group sp. BfR-BA-01363]
MKQVNYKDIKTGEALTRITDWSIDTEIPIACFETVSGAKVQMSKEDVLSSVLPEISTTEKIELSYLYLKGYRYITKHIYGMAYATRKTPKWFSLVGPGWVNQNDDVFTKVDLGTYLFMEPEEAPVLIEDLINISEIK